MKKINYEEAILMMHAWALLFSSNSSFVAPLLHFPDRLNLQKKNRSDKEHNQG